jgi:hypothetical protein
MRYLQIPARERVIAVTRQNTSPKSTTLVDASSYSYRLSNSLTCRPIVEVLDLLPIGYASDFDRPAPWLLLRKEVRPRYKLTCGKK